MIGFILLLISIVILFFPRTKPKIKVYGVMSCGWTKKQLEYLGGRADFIDCSKGGCPEWVTGYPCLELPDGTRHTGFTKIN